MIQNVIDILKLSVIATAFTELQEPGMIFAWYGKLITKLPAWLYFPLGGCVKCFAGQLALWYFLIVHFRNYNFIEHLFFISAVIFLSLIFSKIWELSES